MATADLQLSSTLCWYVIPGLIGLVTLIALFRFGGAVWTYVFAVWYSRCFCHNTDKKLRSFKLQLFRDLENFKSRDWQLRNEGLVRILEIGSGPGANFQYYPKNSRIVCYDPNPHFQKYLFENHTLCAEVNLERFVVAGGEKLVGTGDESVDVVVSTIVNCSVNDLKQVLSEAKRVLAPGGRYYFLDHVVAPKGTLAFRAQKLMRPLWQVVMKCDLQCDVGRYVNEAGFSNVHVEPFVVDFPFPLNLLSHYFVMGYATK